MNRNKILKLMPSFPTMKTILVIIVALTFPVLCKAQYADSTMLAKAYDQIRSHPQTKQFIKRYRRSKKSEQTIKVFDSTVPEVHSFFSDSVSCVVDSSPPQIVIPLSIHPASSRFIVFFSQPCRDLIVAQLHAILNPSDMDSYHSIVFFGESIFFIIRFTNNNIKSISTTSIAFN